jgi:hypothetical protein
MTQVLLTRHNNHPFLNGILPFVSVAATNYLVSTKTFIPWAVTLFTVLAVVSLFVGIFFWRTRNIIIQEGEDLIFKGYFSRLQLPADKVLGIQTQRKLFGQFKLLVKTEAAHYAISIPDPNPKDWALLQQHLG